jgi:hypothetical protein
MCDALNDGTLLLRWFCSGALWGRQPVFEQGPIAGLCALCAVYPK